MARVSAVSGVSAKLGETPLWSVEEQALYWIDVEAPALFRRDATTGEVERWAAPCRIGGVVLRHGGGLVVALRTGIYSLSRDFSATELIAPVPFDSDHLFLHEARCDPRGRLWVGLINADMARRPGGATLFRLERDRLVEQKLAAGGSVSNGLAWNRAGNVLYYADSVARTVMSFDYDLETGAIANRRVFAQFAAADGYPDGAAVDAEDGYWVSLCGAGQVMRLNPDGTKDRAIKVPSALPTALAFGGAALDRMYISSIGDRAILPGFSTSPQDGCLFETNPRATGLQEPAFKS